MKSNEQISDDELRALLDRLALEFEPASVSMTSTNIPDSITKLSSVISSTEKAAREVLLLAEAQKDLVRNSMAHHSKLTRLLRQERLDYQAVRAEMRAMLEAMEGIESASLKIIMAQEFQDLCSQKISKVSRLISGLDRSLRSLLQRFGYSISTQAEARSIQDEDADLSQNEADEILRRLGL